MAEVKYNKEEFDKIVPRVAEHLIQKGRRELRRQDQFNKVYIDEVLFWFEMSFDRDGRVIEDGNLMLSFNATPDLWNFKRILEKIELDERTWLIRDGIAIDGYQR